MENKISQLVFSLGIIKVIDLIVSHCKSMTELYLATKGNRDLLEKWERTTQCISDCKSNIEALWNN